MGSRPRCSVAAPIRPLHVAGRMGGAERSCISATSRGDRPAIRGRGSCARELEEGPGKPTSLTLFERVGSHPLASLGRASVIFDRGDFKTGADLAERHLRRLPASNRTERAAALELMVRACMEQGRTDEATQAVAELRAIANEAGTGPLQALASLAAVLVAAAISDPKSARKHLEIVDLFKESGQLLRPVAHAWSSLGNGSARASRSRRERGPPRH